MAKKILYSITTDNIDGVNLALENKEDDVTILLLQNAVYFANKTCTEIGTALSQNIKVLVSKEDVDLRGISGLMAAGIGTVDYSGIVDAIFASDTVFNY